MKVFIVRAMSAEAYENNSWVEKVFMYEKSARDWIDLKEVEQEGLPDYGQYIYFLDEHEVGV
jgi:hypothetical protein